MKNIISPIAPHIAEKPDFSLKCSKGWGLLGIQRRWWFGLGMELRAHAALICLICPKTLMAKGKLLCTRPTRARAVCSVHCATIEHTCTVYRFVCASVQSGWTWWILAIQLQNILCTEIDSDIHKVSQTGMRIKGRLQTIHFCDTLFMNRWDWIRAKKVQTQDKNGLERF